MKVASSSMSLASPSREGGGGLQASIAQVKIGSNQLEQSVVDAIERRYMIGETIGEGTFSFVRKGVDRETGEEVAVKIISKQQVTKVHQEELLREMEILTKVSHPHIIQLKAIYDTGTDLYIIMELASGGLLYDRIIAKGSYTEGDARALVASLCDAVAHLHSQHVIHRDLKPENLLMKLPDDDTSVKIADFGLSKIIDQETLLLTACGTPAYVAPELLHAAGYDNAVDMWAIGIITYTLLCGYPPFTAEQLPDLLEQIMNATYEFPDEYWAGVSNDAKDFITRLLVVVPKNRLTAQEALKHPWLNNTNDALLERSVLHVQDKMRQTVEDRKESKQSQIT